MSRDAGRRCMRMGRQSIRAVPRRVAALIRYDFCGDLAGLSDSVQYTWAVVEVIVRVGLEPVSCMEQANRDAHAYRRARGNCHTASTKLLNAVRDVIPPVSHSPIEWAAVRETDLAALRPEECPRGVSRRLRTERLVEEQLLLREALWRVAFFWLA